MREVVDLATLFLGWKILGPSEGSTSASCTLAPGGGAREHTLQLLHPVMAPFSPHLLTAGSGGRQVKAPLPALLTLASSPEELEESR